MSHTTTSPAAATVTESPAALPDGALAVFDVAPSVLDRALRIAMVSASKDDTLPVLSTVALTVTPAGSFVALSTDRYRMLRARIDNKVPGMDDAVQNVAALADNPALIPLAEIKNLLSWLKPRIKRRGAEFPVTATVTGHEGTGGTYGTTGAQRLQLTDADGSVYVINLLADAAYPKVHALITTRPVDADGVTRVAFNPTYLAEMAKAAGIGCERNTPVELILATPSKPAMFRGSDSHGIIFDGILMPVRLPDVGRPTGAATL